MLSLLYGPTLKFMHDYWKNHSFDYVDLVSKVMSLLFNTFFEFVITFLLRSKHLLISWLQSLANMLLEKSGEITAEIMKRWILSKNNAGLWT